MLFASDSCVVKNFEFNINRVNGNLSFYKWLPHITQRTQGAQRYFVIKMFSPRSLYTLRDNFN